MSTLPSPQQDRSKQANRTTVRSRGDVTDGATERTRGVAGASVRGGVTDGAGERSTQRDWGHGRWGTRPQPRRCARKDAGNLADASRGPAATLPANSWRTTMSRDPGPVSGRKHRARRRQNDAVVKIKKISALFASLCAFCRTFTSV